MIDLFRALRTAGRTGAGAIHLCSRNS
jgi:hypothetical protein